MDVGGAEFGTCGEESNGDGVGGIEDGTCGRESNGDGFGGPVGGTCGRESSRDGGVKGNNIEEIRSRDDVTPCIEQWTNYNKTGGHAEMSGELFEVKMAALLFLRGLNHTDEFWLTSNMTSAGLFDDLTFVQRDQDANIRAACIQLKHKKPKVGECDTTSVEENGAEVDTEIVSNKQYSKIKCIQSQSLVAVSGNYSLIKYLNSFNIVKENHRKHKDLKFIRQFDNIQFVIFTNAGVAQNLLPDLIEVKGDDFFITTGKAYKLNPKSKICAGLKEFFKFKVFLEELKTDVGVSPSCKREELIKERVNALDSFVNCDIKAKCQQLIKTPFESELVKLLEWDVLKYSCKEETCIEFINNLRICTNQANENKLESLIKTEIETVCQCITESELNAMYDEILKRFTMWWRNENEVLKPRSRIWLDIFHSYVATVSRLRNDALKSFGIDFRANSKEVLKKKIQDSRILVLAPEGEATTLTAIKVLSILQPIGLTLHHESIFVGLDVFMKHKDEILSAWQSRWFSTLVIECGVDANPDICSDLSRDLLDISDRFGKTAVLIAKKEHSLITAMKRVTFFDEMDDHTSWNDLTDSSQNQLRLKKVNFQGTRILLDDLAGNDNNLLSKLDGIAINRMLDGSLMLGKKLNETNKLYVPRKVGKVDDFVHLLSDVPDKVVLITGEPGIGKTCLIDKLANSTKEKDSSLWIASLSMPECSEYLEELNLTDVNNLTAVEFIRRFSTNSCTSFEEEFFNRCVRTEKIIVLLDAIDEVSPHLENKVMAILGKLRDTKLRALWATSRLGMQRTIEGVLKVASKKLAYFSKENQAHLLKAFWKSKNPQIDDKSLDKIASAFWKLTSKTFIEDDFLTGIPQLTIMLVETFERDLITSNGDSTQLLPKSIDLLQLYDGFVKKKHEMYFKANKIEQEKNFKICMNNHMRAAVWTLFSKHDYADLEIPNRDMFELELKRFCNEIQEGLEKTGIIDGFSSTLNRPRFLHRTFCEYFFAKWASLNFEKNVDFLTKKMFDSSFKIINVFLNRILANGHKLHVSVLNRDLNSLDRLLRTNPESINERDEGGRTALHLATLMWDYKHKSTYEDIARKLLEHGALVSYTDRVLNLRPLEIADKSMAWTIARLILQHGGDVRDLRVTENNMDAEVYDEFIEFMFRPDDNTAELMITATKHDEKLLIHYLVEEHMADVNCLGDDDVTLMHWAAYYGHINLMTYLLKNGGQYTSLDKNRNLPLHYAANHGKKNAVEFLVELGSDINAVNSFSETPLLIAAGSADADLEVIKYLIIKGATINVCNNNDLSPLYLAVESGKLETVKYLCNAMELMDRNKFGQSAFQCALQKNDWNMINFLRDGAMITLPKTLPSSTDLVAIATKLAFGIFVLVYTVLSCTHLLDSVPDVLCCGIHAKLQSNSTYSHGNQSRENIVNMALLSMGEHSHSPSNDIDTLYLESALNSSWLSTVWFMDHKQVLVSEDTIWTLILNTFTLILLCISRGWTAFLISLGLLGWSIGLLFSTQFFSEIMFILAIGCFWVVAFFVTENFMSRFQGSAGILLSRILNICGVIVWTLSLIHKCSISLGLLFVVLGGMKVLVGVSWRQDIPFEARCYNMFLAVHCTGISCATWFSWSLGADVWPVWLIWSCRLVFTGYVAGVVAFISAESFLPVSIDKELKTTIKHRFAWLLLLVPMWAYVSAGYVLWSTKLSWVRWIVMLVVPLPVFTLFFEWGRSQLLISNHKG